MRAKRKIINIDEGGCNSCGKCVISCAECSFANVGGKAKVRESYCDRLGTYLGGCPTGALIMVGAGAMVMLAGVLKFLEKRPEEDGSELGPSKK